MAKKSNIYQVDQSIKIENTNKTTYVAISNGSSLVVSISSKDKKLLKLFFRKLNRPLIFRLFTFSVLCAKVILEAQATKVIIDREYIGHEIDIKSFMVQITSIWNYNGVSISFKNIGKSSSAHEKVYKAYKTKKSDTKVKANEVLILYNLINKA